MLKLIMIASKYDTQIYPFMINKNEKIVLQRVHSNILSILMKHLY